MVPQLTIILTLLTPVAGAEIYRCTGENGQPVFSERPCGVEAELVVVDPVNSRGLQADPDQVSRSDKMTARIIERQNEQMEIQQVRNASRRRIAEYEEKKRECEDQVRGTYHPGFGFTRDERALTECKTGYDELIQRERLVTDRRIQQLRASLARKDHN